MLVSHVGVCHNSQLKTPFTKRDFLGKTRNRESRKRRNNLKQCGKENEKNIAKHVAKIGSGFLW
jgi:hypothetical protein